MKRKILEKLMSWIKEADRHPLVIRGARQVGKTWVVRHLAEILEYDLLELNFERDSKLITLFQSNDPEKILLNLTSFLNRKIDVKRTILFLDEIQAAPQLLAKLRWFAEEKPELAVIATGSLLDFALENHQFSMPVGRINYMYLDPMSFEEFLLARNQESLCHFLSTFTLGNEIPIIIHERLLEFLREYMFVGGMPAAVYHWIREQSFIGVSEIHQNILATYHDDFAKYAGRLSVEYLNDIFKAIPNLLGNKFKYSHVNKEVRFEGLKKALNLLVQARVCHKVQDCAANGIPLDSGIRHKTFKVIFLDVGLVSAAMGVTYAQLQKLIESKVINEGGIAEQLTGQLLRTIFPYFMDPKLYYWVREKTGSSAEIDYVIQHNMNVIPIEVKSGTTGTFRSLHMFMKEKHLKLAVKLNADLPSVTPVKVKDFVGESIEYTLISLPLYLVEQMPRLLEH